MKRPDLLWMFRRKDVFVAYNGYDVVDGRIVVSQAPEATGKGACKAMGVNYDDCVLWAGLPVMGEDGTVYGTVGDVSFDPKTGEVRSLTVTQGATANALLGVREIPGHLIRGFKRGIGTALSVNGQDEGRSRFRRHPRVRRGGRACRRGWPGREGRRGHGRGGRPRPRDRRGREAGRVHCHQGCGQSCEQGGLRHGPPDQARQRHVLRLQGGVRQGSQGRRLGRALWAGAGRRRFGRRGADLRAAGLRLTISSLR
ncbi:MAG: PRC-barrel domain-containing protein [Adlercreutzia equolifaciens]